MEAQPALLFMWLHFPVKLDLCLFTGCFLSAHISMMHCYLQLCDKAGGSPPSPVMKQSLSVLCGLVTEPYAACLVFSLAEHHRRARDPKYLLRRPGPGGPVHVCLHHQGPADQPPLLPCLQHSGRGKDDRTVSRRLALTL